MREKKSFSIVERAIILVPEFEGVIKHLSQQVTLRGQSPSTLNNYIRRIALFVIHFGRLPEQVTEDEVNEYLVALARDPKSPSRSSFKNMVYGLRSMASAQNVIHYLGQYTHRVAISNPRILDISETHVKFIAKDYRVGTKQKLVRLDGLEFLRRFCLHIMPKRFVRIRRYGIYNPIAQRNMDLQFEPEQKPDIEELSNPKAKETKAEMIIRLTGFDSGQCPKCKKGRMLVVEELPRIRSPAGHLPTIFLSLLK